MGFTGVKLSLLFGGPHVTPFIAHLVRKRHGFSGVEGVLASLGSVNLSLLGFAQNVGVEAA